MPCTPQELVNANPCFNCLTEQQADWVMTLLLCVKSGGVTPIPPDVAVIGAEDGSIIVGEGDYVFGVE